MASDGNCSSPVGQGKAPDGYGPADLQSAYGLTCAAASQGAGRIVALVESGATPTLENDLNVYRAKFGLPACTVTNGCLSIVGQDGSAKLPPYDPNWSGETMLDVDVISAICPNCRILVVETKPNDGTSGLDTGVDTAVKLGAFAVGISWGSAPEKSSELSHFTHPGVPIAVAQGDDGYEGYQGGVGSAQTPSSFSTVIAVGGTTLSRDQSGAWTEKVWYNGSHNATGSACSKVIAKPSWQTDTGCTKRTVGDIAFDADPTTGVASYDSNQDDSSRNGGIGWQVEGGTSAGAPAIAAMYALAGASASNAASIYRAAGTSALHDITVGSNGTCSLAYLCNAEIGYDAPTGNGTPNGLGAFQSQ